MARLKDLNGEFSRIIFNKINLEVRDAVPGPGAETIYSLRCLKKGQRHSRAALPPQEVKFHCQGAPSAACGLCKDHIPGCACVRAQVPGAAALGPGALPRDACERHPSAHLTGLLVRKAGVRRLRGRLCYLNIAGNSPLPVSLEKRSNVIS